MMGVGLHGTKKCFKTGYHPENFCGMNSKKFLNNFMLAHGIRKEVPCL